MIKVNHAVTIGEDELEESFIRSSGPGGQNVNKVATAVQLRFDAANSPSLPEGVRRRLRGVAGSRMTSDGVVVITADSYRSRERNREAARERLAELVRRACHTPRPRTATKPTRSSRERRLEAKTRRGRTKQMRGGFRGEE